MIVAAVLAAGGSRRLGERKQLVATGEGPLLRAVTARVLAVSGLARVGVVLGAHREEIAPALAGLDVTALANEGWAEGMSSSVRVAAAWAEELTASALVLVVCDQAELSTAHVDALLALHARSPGVPVGSAYAGVVGVPAIFPAHRFEDLAALRGDQGARALLRANEVVSVPWSAGERDVDTPADVIAMTHPSSKRCHKPH